MKNITVSVDEGTYRLARIRAAELDTSVSAMVRGYLRSLVANGGGASADGAGVETLAEQRGRLLREVIDEITANGGGLRMEDNLSREELYDRDAARAEAERERRRRMSA